MLAIFFFNVMLFSASFDCQKASISIEKAICSNKELSELDSKLGVLYKAFVEKYGGLRPEKVREEFAENQKHWLKYVRNKSNKVERLLSIYKERVSYLEANLVRLVNGFTILTNDSYQPEHYVSILGNTNERLESFNKSGSWYFKNIDKKDVQVIDCNALLMVAVGTARGNRSYGGICTVKRDDNISSVMICDDDMVGHFKIKEKGNKTSLYDLGKFIYNNCYGG